MKPEGSWWNAKHYPSVPYLFNLLMDSMEKMDPESHEWGYAGKVFRLEDVGADGGRFVHCRALEEPAGVLSATSFRHAKPAQSARGSHGEDGKGKNGK